MSAGALDDYDADGIPDEAEMDEKPAEPGLIGHGGGDGIGHGRGGKVGAKPKPVVITIRTQFPETFLWKSDLVADPRADLTTLLPDAISEQEFIIVASDENGGVGLLRKRVEVTQPVFVRADFPERLRAGESVAVPVVVHNRTPTPRDFSIELAVAGQAALSKPLTVAPRSVAATVFDVLVKKPGPASYRIQAKTPGHEDHVTGKVEVAPQGVPTLFTSAGVAAKSKPFSARWTVTAASTGNQAWLSIAFPSVTSALVGADAIGKLVAGDPLAIASDLLSAALVLDYARRNQLASPRLADLELMVREAVAMLQLYQHKDGSFAYWRNQKKSPYITAWVLEGLLAARALALPVSDQSLASASTWLSDQFLADGLVDVSDVAFWEGDTRAVRAGLSTEIFDVLTMVPTKLRAPRTRALIDKLAVAFTAYLERADPDPLTAGRALQGLTRLGKLDKSKGRAIIANLITRRDHGHWEPSWFHAYGGTVEASVAMLAAIEAIDPSGFASEKRDAIAYVMATREAWGTWHNERGTAAAIRALLICGSPAEEIPGTVTVTVDGKVIRTVKIDPDDPFMSAIALNHVDLGEHLAAGDHEVAVSYSGKLSPAVTLAARSWNVASSREASVETAGVRTKLWVAAPARSNRGDAVDVRLDIGRPPTASIARLLIPESSLMEVDLTRLAANIALNPTLARYRLTDAGVEIELTPRANPAGAIIPFKAVRAGYGQWPTMLVAADGEVLTVSAGELHVAP